MELQKTLFAKCKFNNYNWFFYKENAEFYVGISSNENPDKWSIVRESEAIELLENIIDRGGEFIFENQYKLLKIDPIKNKTNYIVMNTDITSDKLEILEYDNFGDKTPVNTYNFSYKNDFDYVYSNYLKNDYIDASTSNIITNKKLDDISDSDIKKLIDELKNHSTHVIDANYNVKASSVSYGAIRVAENILMTLEKLAKLGANKDDINFNLLKLYTKIPRHMNNVSDYFIGTDINTVAKLNDLNNIIQNETALLKTLKFEVYTIKQNLINNTPSSTKASSGNLFTYLDAIGIEVTKPTQSEIDYVKDMMDKYSNKFLELYRVKNHKTDKAFNAIQKPNGNVTLMFHGSRQQNILSILKDGLKINKSNAIVTAKMYGLGIYFTDNFDKASNYSGTYNSYFARGNTNIGYVLVYDVYLGNAYQANKNWETWFKNFTEADLKKLGNFDSVYAEKGYGINPKLPNGLRNPEWVIYNENHCNIKYIIKYKD